MAILLRVLLVVLGSGLGLLIGAAWAYASWQASAPTVKTMGDGIAAGFITLIGSGIGLLVGFVLSLILTRRRSGKPKADSGDGGPDSPAPEA